MSRSRRSRRRKPRRKARQRPGRLSRQQVREQAITTTQKRRQQTMLQTAASRLWTHMARLAQLRRRARQTYQTMYWVDYMGARIIDKVRSNCRAGHPNVIQDDTCWMIHVVASKAAAAQARHGAPCHAVGVYFRACVHACALDDSVSVPACSECLTGGCTCSDGVSLSGAGGAGGRRGSSAD